MQLRFPVLFEMYVGKRIFMHNILVLKREHVHI
jgi:hypothetical protein